MGNPKNEKKIQKKTRKIPKLTSRPIFRACKKLKHPASAVDVGVDKLPSFFGGAMSSNCDFCRFGSIYGN